MPAAAPRNASLNQLRADYKTDLTLMIAESYAQNRDLPAALDSLARIEPADPYSFNGECFELRPGYWLSGKRRTAHQGAD